MTKAIVNRFVPTGYLSHVQLQGDANTYTAGGFQFSPGDFGFVDRIDDVIPVIKTGNFTVEWDSANQLLKVETDPGTGLAEVANGGSTAGLVVDLYAFGE